MSPVSLCAEKHYKELRKGIARTFRDGMGEKRLRMGEKCWKLRNLLRRNSSEGWELKWSTFIILGEVTCCFSNGCNLSLEMARESLVSLPFDRVPTLKTKKNDKKSQFFTICLPFDREPTPKAKKWNPTSPNSSHIAGVPLPPLGAQWDGDNYSESGQSC